MRILVTGAAGFIGSHLVDALLARGNEVVGIDNFNDFYDPSIKRANIEPHRDDAGFRLVEGDIRDPEAVEAALAPGIDVVVHLAAMAGVRPSLSDPALYVDVNLRGTTTLYDAAVTAGVKRIVFASSSSVYGANEKVPFEEDDRVDHPVSPYAATKKAGELLSHTYHHIHGIAVTCLRFFTVYGPRQRPEMAIHKFTRLIDDGRPVPMFGDGTSRRDYTYIDDIIDGVVRAIDRCEGFRVYNLGESQTIELRELIALISRSLGREAVIERLPDQPGDVPATYASVERARAELGYQPTTAVEEGIERFVRWFRDLARSER